MKRIIIAILLFLPLTLFSQGTLKWGRVSAGFDFLLNRAGSGVNNGYTFFGPLEITEDGRLYTFNLPANANYIESFRLEFEIPSKIEKVFYRVGGAGYFDLFGERKLPRPVNYYWTEDYAKSVSITSGNYENRFRGGSFFLGLGTELGWKRVGFKASIDGGYYSVLAKYLLTKATYFGYMFELESESVETLVYHKHGFGRELGAGVYLNLSSLYASFSVTHTSVFAKESENATAVGFRIMVGYNF
ncbi:MAG TPA: hypothetical protein ENN61_00345 [Bacteroidaceae bacterium]|mgnify:CR=1 FL=1|nr:hypothetical protein [Bacteroidaceae bacterium]